MNISKKFVASSGMVLLASLAIGFTVPVHAEKGGKHGQSHAKQAKQDKTRSGQSKHYGKHAPGQNNTQAYRLHNSHGVPNGPYGGSGATHFRFDDRQRRLVQDYFGARGLGGNCPPGLAKKGRSCLPPGQARQWQLNQTLPGDLERYPLPPDLLTRLPSAPDGYEYVRSANDILLISTGTNMVIDALRGLVH